MLEEAEEDEHDQPDGDEPESRCRRPAPVGGAGDADQEGGQADAEDGGAFEVDTPRCPHRRGGDEEMGRERGEYAHGRGDPEDPVVVGLVYQDAAER